MSGEKKDKEPVDLTRKVVAGGFVPVGNGRHYQIDAIMKDMADSGWPVVGTPEWHRQHNRPGIFRRPMLPIGLNFSGKQSLTTAELIMGNHMWEAVMRNKVGSGGGGFRRGELAMISAGAPNPLDRFKSNWLGAYVSDFVARGPKPVDEQSILQLFAEPEITGNDFYHRLRNLVNAGLPIHTVRIPGGTRPEKIVRYTGYTDRSTVYEDVVASIRSNPDALGKGPFIEVKGWGIWVGGKKICTMPLTMRDMVIDSVTSRWQMRGQYGAYGQVTLEYPAHDYEYVPQRISPVREDWAEEAIDKLVYLQINGHHYGTNRNGDLIIPGRITTFGLQTAQYHKIQARERLRAASNPERQKRGH